MPYVFREVQRRQQLYKEKLETILPLIHPGYFLDVLTTAPDVLSSLGTDAAAAKTLLWHVFEPATIVPASSRRQSPTSFQAAFATVRPDADKGVGNPPEKQR